MDLQKHAVRWACNCTYHTGNAGSKNPRPRHCGSITRLGSQQKLSAGAEGATILYIPRR